MIINHNVSTTQASRMEGISNTGMSKSMDKLASGYRTKTPAAETAAPKTETNKTVSEISSATKVYPEGSVTKKIPEAPEAGAFSASI